MHMWASLYRSNWSQSTLCLLTGRAKIRFKAMPSEFDLLFCSATKRARVAAGYTQLEMAENLGVTRSTYRNYEVATPLSGEYLLKFCMLTEVRVTDMLNIDFLRRAEKEPKE
jgi:hypothetical protein